MSAGLQFASGGRAFGTDFGTAVADDLAGAAATAEQRIAQVHTGAMASVVSRYKDRLRADIVSGGFYAAVKLSKTWQGRTFPSRKASMEPAGYVFTSAATIVDAFTLGATITVRNAQFLAVPEGPAKAIVRRLNQAANRTRNANGQFADEAGTVARVAAALSVDRLEAHVDDRTGRGVLVAAGQRVTRGGRQAKRQAGPATVLFALVRQASLKQRIQGRALLASFDGTFGADFDAALDGQLTAQERG